MALNYLQAVQRVCLRVGIPAPSTLSGAGGDVNDIMNIINDEIIKLAEDDSHHFNEEIYAVRLLGEIDTTCTIAANGDLTLASGELRGDYFAGDDADTRQDFVHGKLITDTAQEMYEIETVLTATTGTVATPKAAVSGGTACLVVQDMIKAPMDCVALEEAFILNPSGTSVQLEIVGLEKLLRMRNLRSYFAQTGTTRVPVRCSMWFRDYVSSEKDHQGNTRSNIARRYIVVDPPPSADSVLILAYRRKLWRLSDNTDSLPVDEDYESYILHRATAIAARDRRNSSHSAYFEARYEQRRKSLLTRIERTTSRAKVQAHLSTESEGV